HGFYLATAAAAAKVASKHNVVVEGCFAKNSDGGQSSPAIHRSSFELEKMLSSDSAQLISYSVDGSEIVGLFRALSSREIRAREPRAALREGARAFLAAGLEIREKLHKEFRVSVSDASDIYAAFVNDMSPSEKEVIASIALDDAYCGRGVVS